MSRCMLAIGLLLTSCAAWDPPGDVAAPVAAYVAAPAGIAASAPAADANQLAPRGELTTQDALAWAWYNHPKMKRAQRMIGEARGGRVQAGLWPNPTVGAGYVEEKNYKKGAQFSLAQKFEMGGKLRPGLPRPMPPLP